jgi:hypothetical protein
MKSSRTEGQQRRRIEVRTSVILSAAKDLAGH